MNQPVTIIVAPVSDDRISDDLRTLTRLLVTAHGADYIGGGLGGEWGYGTHFTNDTFEMNPENWGDCACTRDEDESRWCEENDHTDACYQHVIRARGFLDYDEAPNMGYHARDAHNRAITDAVCAEMGLDPEHGSYVHCTCTHTADYVAWVAAHPHDNSICPVDRPNFRHKPTGAVVNFYKYIGRSMRVDLNGADWSAVINDCHQSLSATP